MRLSAFTIGVDGSLSHSRIWADIKPHFPDGICLDAAGGIWVADPAQSKVIWVAAGGEITDMIDPGRPAFACMLGGNDRKRLFFSTASGSGANRADLRDSKIEFVDVDIPGAGWP